MEIYLSLVDAGIFWEVSGIKLVRRGGMDVMYMKTHIVW